MSTKKTSSTTSTGNTVKLNSTELKDLVKYLVSNNLALQNEGKAPISLNIVGEAGVSKTASVEQVAKELDIEFVKLSVAQIEDPSELAGFPYKEYLYENAETKTQVWINEHSIPEYLALGFKPLNNTRMGYAAPEWIVGKGEGGILLLDDATRGSSMIQQALMDIIDRQSCVSWKLPKGWTVISTTNPDNGQYMVTTVDNAYKTRQLNVEMKFDVNVWAQWAEEYGVDSRCINFLLKHPELITECKDGSVNARIFTKFFDSLKTIGEFEKNLATITMLGEGSVGIEATSMFTQFIHEKLDKLLTPQQMLEMEEKEVLKNLKSVIKTGNETRADIANILATRLKNYCMSYAKDNNPSKEMQARIAVLFESELFTTDITQVVMRKLGTHPKFKNVLTPKLTKYLLNN